MAASALEKGAVRFVCQRCKQPLKIDLSFETIDQQTELVKELTDTLLNQLDEQLKVTEEECRDYRNFLDRLDTVHGEQDEQALLDDELAREEKTKVEEDIKKERETTKKLEEEEDRYWREYNEYKRQVQELDDEQKRYRLVPYGSRSYLESLTDKSKELPLYCSGGFRFFWDAKFDQAMVAFLDCVQQFKEAVERGDSQFCLPYRMEKDKIEDTSNGQAFSVKEL
ncbi:BECN1-like protein [Mya arenaria]|uniref:BECN1-like protein n=1 Tax=Mya arenaria TaxID=6604 RepID=A0ABY7EMX0_MYAAR|nr:BECN1-like protein [Mya arenaria]